MSRVQRLERQLADALESAPVTGTAVPPVTSSAPPVQQPVPTATEKTSTEEVSTILPVY